MWTKYSTSLLIVPLVAGRGLHATRANNTTIASRVASGIQTECKVCPYKLCTNHVDYLYETTMTLTCWTYGDNIVDTDIWLKTMDGCYVTEWDIIDYDGDYTETPGFPYCGDIPEKFTTGLSRTIYNTECNMIPQFVKGEDQIKMYRPEVDLTITCQTREGDEVLGNTLWFKTISNCYVPGAQVQVAGTTTLDQCGPVPFMEMKMREADPTPTPTPSAASLATREHEGRDSLWGRRDEQPSKDTSKRWLYPTRVGDEYANCFSDPISDSKVMRVYDYDDLVVVQCATYGIAPEDDTIYLLTEYFCWVNDTLTDPQLVDDTLRSQIYPNCLRFTDTHA